MTLKKITARAAEEAIEHAKQEEVQKALESKQPLPHRVQLNFTAADTPDGEDIQAIYDALVELGQRRGFFFEFGFVAAMEEEDVIEDSPLAQGLDAMRHAYWKENGGDN